MDYSEEKFQEQIRAIVEAGETGTEEIGDRALTLAELKELAISMGVTEEGWQNLLKRAAVHLRSADDHLKARNFKEAISEGEQAIGINPYLPNCNAILARAYLMLWMEEECMSDEKKAKAEFHARQELKVDPRDMIAVNVLSTIEKKAGIHENEARSKKYVFIGAAVAIVILVILLLVMLWPTGDGDSADTGSNNSNSEIRDQLIGAEEDVALKLDLVQVAIDQRNGLIPEITKSVPSDGTSDSLNKEISSLQSRIDRSREEQRFALESEMTVKLNALVALGPAEERDDWREKLLVELEGCENRIAFEKKNYNEAVKRYNVLLKKHKDEFPDFEIKPYFSE